LRIPALSEPAETSSSSIFAACAGAVPEGVETCRDAVSGTCASVPTGTSLCEEREASAARWRRSNSACWSAGRRGGQGVDWRKEEEDARRWDRGVRWDTRVGLARGRRARRVRRWRLIFFGDLAISVRSRVCFVAGGARGSQLVEQGISGKINRLVSVGNCGLVFQQGVELWC
jgi:hypothetical protein